MEQNRFDEILKQKMEGCQAQPPVDMFSRIEQTISAIDAAAAQPTAPRPKRAKLWSTPLVRYAAAAVVAAVATTAVVTLNRPLDEAPTAQAEMATEVVEVSEPVAVQQNPIAATLSVPKEATRSIIPTQKHAPVVEQSAADQKADSEAQSAPKEVIPTSEPKSETTASATKPNRKSQSKEKSAKVYTEEEIDEYWREVLDADRRSTIDLSRLSTTLYAGNIGIGRGDMNLSNINTDPMLVNESPMSSPSQFTSLPSMAPAKPESKLEHRMPVTFGLTLSYQLGDAFALESGLIYTNMFSASESWGTDSQYGRRRDLHYLGIPVAATCRLFSIKVLDLYMRVGGTAEKCVYGADRYYMDGKLSETTVLEADTFQFSVDASIGVQYPLWRGLSVYGEGGISYYLPSEAQPESYRTVNPLNASLRLGFRYAFL